MKIYTVGGAVRDALLGVNVKDRDYVVVGATPEDMERRGFKPVGTDFPVFLHPTTHEEYALARTERKTGRGYKGFAVHAAPDVTLEQDLARRDLTINAMAQDEQGTLIDPYGGEADLRAGVLRHVSPAFVEDPVRVLRVARFAARYGFAIAPETMALMRQMAANGEVDALVPERVWQEFAKGLKERTPRRMFDVLIECGALERILPEWKRVAAERALRALDCTVAHGHGLAVRYAALFAAAPVEVAAQAATRLRAPSDCTSLAVLAAGQCSGVRTARTLEPGALVDLLQLVDAFRRPTRFSALLDACECDGAAMGALDEGARLHLTRALAAAQSVDAAAVARAAPRDIAAAIREARIAAVAAARVAER